MKRLLVAILFLPAFAWASVTSTTEKTGPFVITGLPQVIPVGFPFQFSSDLTVLDMGSTGTPRDPATILALGSDYTVTGGGYNNQNQMQVGSITVVSTGVGAVLASDQIVIARNPPLNQTTSFIATGPLTISLLEQALDKQATLSQEVNDLATRSLHFENFEFLNGNLSLTARANNYLAFNALGQIVFMPSQTEIITGTGLEVASIAALRALPTTSLSNGQSIKVDGYYSAGDAAGVRFYTLDLAATGADDGGNNIIPSIGPGHWLLNVSANPTVIPNVSWWGAWGDNTHDDTVAFYNAFAWLQARNGGSLAFGTNATYLVNPTINTNWITLSSVPLNLQFNGCTIHVGTAFTPASTQYCILFVIQGCSPVRIGPVTFTGQNMIVPSSGSIDSTGYTAFDFVETGGVGCSNVASDWINQTGGQACVEIYRGANSQPVSSRSTGFDLKINTFGVYYPVQLQHSGDVSNITVICNEAFRPFFVFGCKNVRLNVTDTNHLGSSAIACWNETAQNNWSDDPYTNNISVDYTCLPGTTTRGTQGQNIIVQANGPNPCHFANINLHYTVYESNTYPEFYLLAFLKTVNDTTADTTPGRGHILENITVSGEVYNADQGQADLFSFFDAAGSSTAVWTGETINNLHVQDLSVQGNSGNTVAVYDSPINGQIFENIQFPGSLTETGTPPTANGASYLNCVFNGIAKGAAYYNAGSITTGTTPIVAGSGIQVTGGAPVGVGGIGKGGLSGLTVQGVSGATYDFSLYEPNGSTLVAANPHSTNQFLFGGPAIYASYTVSTLPAAASNAFAIVFVTDATSAATTGQGSAPTGSGSVTRPVYSNGSSWLQL